ncbi:hypothetical protein VC83_07086 [Pseudogymnoascus destructans]|uniref:Uncharacterized protein n=1 Tax=Pseudogymnoascus destructans TaxID=655981 RepID=A0A177A572_9PEZI|nr:uncharacterized protein VC83_07086 [Pseudogymnoascus destructans]OAF56780.1 hypothetical protein VC83_07086 [Pseudogymnoascus destructans]
MVDGTIDKSFGCGPFEKHLKNKNINDWILNQYRQSCGVELPGTVNPVVLEIKVKEIVRNFNQVLLESLVPEDVLHAKIEAHNLTF